MLASNNVSSYSAGTNCLGAMSPMGTSTADTAKKTILPVHTATNSTQPTVSDSEKDGYVKSNPLPEITWEPKQPTAFVRTLKRGARYAGEHPGKAFVYSLAAVGTPLAIGLGTGLGLKGKAAKTVETEIKDVCGFKKPFDSGIKSIMTASDGSCPRLHKDFSAPGKWERISVIDSKTGEEFTLGGVQKSASWENGQWNYNPSPNAALYSGGWTLENACLKSGDKTGDGWGGGKNPHMIGPDSDFSYYYVPDKKFDSGDASLFINETGHVHNNPNPNVQYRIISTPGNTRNKTLRQVIDSAPGIQNLTDNQASLARFADLLTPNPCSGQKSKRDVSGELQRTIRQPLTQEQPLRSKNAKSNSKPVRRNRRADS